MLHSPARLRPYLGAESFGEILHATQRGAQVHIVAVQEDAQQGVGGAGIGDQLGGDTRTSQQQEQRNCLTTPPSPITQKPLVEQWPELQLLSRRGRGDRLPSACLNVPLWAPAGSTGPSQAFSPPLGPSKLWLRTETPGKEISFPTRSSFCLTTQGRSPRGAPSPPGEQRTCY